MTGQLKPAKRRRRATAIDEPLLAADEIQGNVLTGFNKDHQMLIALSIRDRAAAKAWLARVTPHISTLGEVHRFNELFRAKRRRLGHDPAGLIATWASVAFSHGGLTALSSVADADAIPDDAFREGLPSRAASLGDAPPADGRPVSADWVIGGAERIPDILLTIASDDLAQLQRIARQLTPGAGDLADAPTVIWSELGQTRSDLPGHEHFGFKDGVSQPTVRGLLKRNPDIPLTRRDLEPPAEGAIAFSSPGNPLLWPGQFVFGYPSGDRKAAGPVPAPAEISAIAENGSLLVFRRLRQDVASFHAFLRAAAASLAATADFPGMTSQRLGALLVGRWPSGAPIARSRGADDPALAADALAANDFLFADDTPEPAFRQPRPSSPFALAIADAAGFVCPHAAHIRKVNPRDQETDKGDLFDTLTRRILRRGIPFGPPLVSPPGRQLPSDDGVERGLHFLCYQTSIAEQFELLQLDWANTANNPKPHGHDMIIGQPSDPTREFELDKADGGSQLVQTDRLFVLMTGGGYFFTPSISTLVRLHSTP